MQFFILGLAVLVLLLVAVRLFVSANPTTLARQLRLAGIAITVFAGILLAIGRQFQFALPLFLAAIWLAARSSAISTGHRSPRGKSEVKTDWLAMELDHDTGEMHGTVLQGQFQGRALEQMDVNELAELWRECRGADPQSGQLIEAFLDRIHPDWRDAHGAPGGSGDADVGPMTVEEAYNILGLAPGATVDDIQRAHRELMKRFHPDRGGSTYFAAKLNEAKELLLQVEGGGPAS